MKVKTVHRILDYSQNLGADEDIITACLATMLSHSAEFRHQFFSDKGIFGKTMSKAYQNWLRSDRSHTESGEIISGCKWLEKNGKKICFKPDVWIWDTEDPDWAKTTKTPTGLNVFIESKLFAELSPNQQDGYRSLKEKLGDRALNLLISQKPVQAVQNAFDKQVTWAAVYDVVKRLRDGFGNDEDLKEVAQILFDRIRPYFDLTEYYDLDDETKRSELLHDILDCIRLRTHLKYNVNPRGRRNANRKYLEKPSTISKWLPIGIQRNAWLTLEAYLNEKNQAGLRLQWWDETTGEERRVHDSESLQERIIFDGDGRIEGWMEILVQVQALAQNCTHPEM